MRTTLLIIFVAVSFVLRTSARDAFVMLSGGYSPFDNNYSQYLQARAMLTFFDRHYPTNSVWVFFGAGNVQGEKAVFGDVRREVKRDGVAVDSWLPGFLPRNRPARREVILKAFKEEILPAVAEGGTLFLFVGDHGSQTRGDNSESVIDLWTLHADRSAERGWKTVKSETLGVAELRGILAGGLGKGKVVFCMTQCHAGGFHFLSVPREITPNPNWFNGPHEKSALKLTPSALPRIAGFTATDERSMASGCDAAPDPESWEGYERFIPEKLLGWNLFTLEPSGRGLPSFAKAHEAATLVDATIDKPYSTSDQYLERWATMIETKLAKETNLTASVRQRVLAYQRVVDGGKTTVTSRDFRERAAMFRRFTERLGEQNPGAKTLLLTGTRKELEEAIGRGRGRGPRSQAAPQSQSQNTTRDQSTGQGRRGPGGRFGEARKLWNDTIRPGWKAAIEADRVTNLPPAVLEFEKYLLAKEAKGKDFLYQDSDSLDVEVFWQSGYSNPQSVDIQKAEAIALWAAERRRKILAWAKTASDESIRTAAEKAAQLRRRPENASAPASGAEPAASPQISKKIAAERTLFYRRVLGAWEFLLAMNEKPALARLRELNDLERTPLPKK